MSIIKGDKIQIKPGDRNQGRIGEVYKVEGGMYPIHVRFDNGDVDIYDEDDVILIEHKEEKVMAGQQHSEETKRSLAWRLPTVAIVALTFTVFVWGWVQVTSLQTNKDIEIQKYQSEQAIQQAKLK